MACRLDRNSLLDHPARNLLYASIRARPGAHFVQLLRLLRADPQLASGAGHGMLMHHLYLLERFHFVVSHKAGRYRRYFENGGRFGRASRQIAVLLAPPMPAIARLLLAHPGDDQKGLLARVRAEWPGTRQALGYQLKRLEREGLLLVIRQGSHRRYYPVAELGRLQEYVDWPEPLVESSVTTSVGSVPSSDLDGDSREPIGLCPEEATALSVP